MKSSVRLAGLMVVSATLVAAPALANAATIQGMIVARAGASVVVRSNGAKQTVTLTDSTDVKAISGVFSLGRDEKAVTDLIPGLPVTIDAEDRGGQLIATKVRFKADQLAIAEQIEAGTAVHASALEDHAVKLNQHAADMEQQQIAHENLVQRFEQLGDYNVKSSIDVQFATGSAAISAADKTALCALASDAKQVKGYLIHVSGHADSRGSAAVNQALSHRRANAVSNHLQQTCGLAPMRLLAPDAMGTATPASADNTPAGLAANRRVNVQILVNRGLEG